MSEKLIAPNKTANTPFEGGGIYIGAVRQVSGNQVFVEIPQIAPRFVFGPCLVVNNRITTTTTSSMGYITSVTVTNNPPAVGDKVVCAFLNNEKSEIIVLGRVLV
jgi:hypothetical protein